MKFLVDAQLPRLLATWLAGRGHDALHTLDLPAANRTTDKDIREMADREQRVVVTKDSDFVDSHVLHGTPAKLLLIATGNITNPLLISLVERHEAVIVSSLEAADFVELTNDRVILHG